MSHQAVSTTNNLTLSIRERPKRVFRQKTMAARNFRISLRNFLPLSLSVIDFSSAARTFFVRVVRPDGMGEKQCFLRIRTVQAVLVAFEEGKGISHIFERGTKTFPYFEVPLFHWSQESESQLV
ncbi:hypothetical protein AVEN_202992-1 [Araneus ventricosus]|uniref:Uncharacterized protein n=1 Tax=Araneus ventricosus TaxID=182803 RepID=A0A4Y2X0T7_ARAVE|nr:hypothetical protein AVEN_202992-1 [Araneus ventricosus]